jgi:hypothetical protein
MALFDFGDQGLLFYLPLLRPPFAPLRLPPSSLDHHRWHLYP